MDSFRILQRHSKMWISYNYMKQLFIKTNSSIYKRNSYFTERHTVKQLIGILIICKTYSGLWRQWEICNIQRSCSLTYTKYKWQWHKNYKHAQSNVITTTMVRQTRMNKHTYRFVGKFHMNNHFLSINAWPHSFLHKTHEGIDFITMHSPGYHYK